MNALRVGTYPIFPNDNGVRILGAGQLLAPFWIAGADPGAIVEVDF